MLRRLIAALLLLAAQPALAGWLVAETPHFRIHGTMSETRLRQEAAVLEDYHRLLEFLTGRTFGPDAPRLDIYLVDSRGQMGIVRQGLGTSVMGFYAPTPGGILAMGLEPGKGDDSWMGGRDVLLHEYAHHFMMQAGSAALPAWYVEGFAEYLMTAEFRPDRIDFGGINKARYYALVALPWAPLEQVLRRARGVNIDSFYAQSWLLTHYLNRAEGMPAKRDAYLRKVAEGADPVEAFRQEIAPDLNAFQGRLRNYLKGAITFSRMTRKPPEAADIRVSALPASADQALLPLVAVQLPQKPAHDAANLQRIRQAHARHAGDPWAERAMAIAEAATGDPKAAAARLDALLAAAPADPVLLRWRASLYKADTPDATPADVSAARRLLVRAFKAAPNDWQVLSDYARTFEARPEPMPAAALDVLGKAYELAPQEKNLAWRTAIAMARAGHFDVARMALGPLVNDPHAGDGMAPGRELLAALRQKDKAAVDTALAALRKEAPEPEAEAD